MKPYTRVYAEIDLDAAVHNMQAMQAGLAAGAKMIGVVKTDGYGHGAAPVAHAIDPYVAGYAVAAIEEARNLQLHGITKPILILGATHPSRSPFGGGPGAEPGTRGGPSGGRYRYEPDRPVLR